MVQGEDEQDAGEEQGGVATTTRSKVKHPKLYKVLLHNDNDTTMEFVVSILQRYFGKSQEEAEQ
ncbi:MAG: ATP-dependent Clp protease adaptor ClpS, partial [Halobacteriovoraceae bacterium]|nr:ATP-dependent Clp protease adaptor ClpS [Halobacteriovoraceae bacterium]